MQDAQDARRLLADTSACLLDMPVVDDDGGYIGTMRERLALVAAGEAVSIF